MQACNRLKDLGIRNRGQFSFAEVGGVLDLGLHVRVRGVQGSQGFEASNLVCCLNRLSSDRVGQSAKV